MSETVFEYENDILSDIRTTGEQKDNLVLSKIESSRHIHLYFMFKSPKEI